MNPFGHWKKILLFGLFGGLGALSGSVLGEGLLRWRKPADRPTSPSLVSKPEPPPSLPDAPHPPKAPDPLKPQIPPPTAPPPPPPDFKRRLDEAGAKTGDVQISLKWDNVNDLDLHCFDPAGEEIYFSRKKSASGGELDVDQNVSRPYRTDPVENIYWPAGGAPLGKYRIYVIHYSNHGGTDPTAYKVNLLNGGQRQEFSGRIKHGDARQLVYEFEVKRLEPALRLAIPPEVVLNQGFKNLLTIRIARDRYEGPVKLRFAGDTEGLFFDEVLIPRDKDEAAVSALAAPDARSGDRSLRVIATGGPAQAEGRLAVRIKEIPRALRLAVPATISLEQGVSNEWTLRIARDFFSAPVTVRFEGDLQGLSLGEIVFPADRTETTATIYAEPDARPGPREVRVRASGGGQEAQANLIVALNAAVNRTAPSWDWQMILVIGGWTALVASGLALALLLGQNRYLGRRMLSPRQLVVLVPGGLAAGLLAGGIGQTLFAILSRAALLPQIGFVIGWLLLGGLLGRGVGLFIPNLNGPRAGISGVIGGLVGALVFLAVSAWGDVVGRLAGAAIVGFAIGLMVALVEAVFREAWLEVHYGPKEVRTVSLGVEPVTIGSEASCTVYLKQAPALALRYVLQDGHIKCAAEQGSASTVLPGEVRMVGGVRVVAQALGGEKATASSAPPAPAAAPTPAASRGTFGIRLAQGKWLPLALGARLTSAELPSLDSFTGDGAIAEVVANPNNPSILGLKNLSAQTWSAVMPDGGVRQIDPGRSIQLLPGVRLHFGSEQADIAVMPAKS